MPTNIPCNSCGTIWNSITGAPICANSWCPLKKYWAKVHGLAPSPVASLSNSNGSASKASVKASKEIVIHPPIKIGIPSEPLETLDARIIIKNDTLSNITKFLCDSFVPVTDLADLKNNMEARMKRYAALALFLSDSVEFSKAASELSLLLEDTYKTLKKKGLRGAFSMVLSLVAESFGFSQDVLILNGQIDQKSFAKVLADKCLFRDVYTRPHGEFSHAIQWLVMGIRYGKVVADLYQHSINYKSNKGFKMQKGKSEAIYLWNFLVDCFVEKDNGAEDYKTNIFADTFRCPQYTTRNLKALTAESWLGEFIYARGKKGLYDGSKVREGSHYFQTEGKWNVIMPASYVKREYKSQNVYEVLENDAEHNPVVLKKRVQEHVGGYSHLFNSIGKDLPMEL